MNQLFHSYKIEAQEVTYTPFLAPDGRVGYVVVWRDGRTSYLYMNPTTETDDGQPNVFIYDGPSPDIEHGRSIVYVDIERDVSW